MQCVGAVDHGAVMSVLGQSICIFLQVSGDPIDDEGGVFKKMISVIALNLYFISNVLHIASNDADFCSVSDIYSVQNHCTEYSYGSV